MSRRRNTPKSFKGEDVLRNFEDTLIALDVIKNHKYITKSEKERALAMIKVAMTLLSISIKYKNLKDDCEAKGVNMAEHSPELDRLRADDDSLETFFGKCSTSDMRKRLKVITRKIIEVSKSLNQ